MQIRRFRAKDYKTALLMIKDEMGPEAVILSTREIKDRGELGPLVEVTAGAGYHPPPPAAGKAGAEKKAVSAQAAPKPAPEPRPAAPEEWASRVKGLEGGLAEIKDLLLDLTHRSNLSERIRNRTDLVRLYRELIDSEIDPGLARALVEKTAVSANGDGKNLKDVLSARLAGLLKTASPISEFRTTPHYIMLAGPSGVGKTTTLAKLAAHWAGKGGKKVAVLSLDTYRLGAAEQLKTYARIMGLPVSIAQGREEFDNALELYENMDIVLIDTAGRCLTAPDAMSELQGFIGGLEGLQVLLVLSAATKDRDIAAAIRQASPLPVGSLVISKIDETQRYGNIINNLIKFKKPVSFLTNGQKVPDDIIQATSARLARLITSAPAI